MACLLIHLLEDDLLMIFQMAKRSLTSGDLGNPFSPYVDEKGNISLMKMEEI
jgi:hypothetical protein